MRKVYASHHILVVMVNRANNYLILSAFNIMISC